MPAFLIEYEWELFKTASYKRDLEKIKVYKDEMKVGFKYFDHSISAHCKMSLIERVATYPVGLVGGGLLGALTAGVGIVVTVIASPAIIAAGVAAGVVGVGSLVGAGAGLAVAHSIVSDSDIWQPQTKKDTYEADPGHFIIEDPTISTYGQGIVKIISRDEKRINYEITALQGTFGAKFTSK